MFKTVCKTPLFTKEKYHYELNQLYYRIFLCNSQMSTSFKYDFSNEHPFCEKRGAPIPGRCSLNNSRQKWGTNSTEALFRAKALFRENTVLGSKLENGTQELILMHILILLASLLHILVLSFSLFLDTFLKYAYRRRLLTKKLI